MIIDLYGKLKRREEGKKGIAFMVTSAVVPSAVYSVEIAHQNC